MSLKQLIRFTNDAAAIEKLLRLFQGLCQVLTAYAFTVESAKISALCRRQFALGRRYIRFFRWIDSFSRAWGFFLGLERPGDLEGWVAVGKWSCFGMYLGMESATILDSMGVYPVEWAKVLIIEGNKFWFYSLLFSIMLSILQLSSLSSTAPSIPPTEKKGEREENITARELAIARKKKRNKINRKLVADCFDLFVPGFVVGWIPTSSAVAGFATVGSSWIGLVDIWDGMG